MKTLTLLLCLFAASVDAPIRLTAEALASAYLDHRAEADKKYTGKTLDVSGSILQVSTSYGKPIVDLETDRMAVVRCTSGGPFNGLRKGQRVTLRGKCDGRPMAGIFLSGCTVVKR